MADQTGTFTTAARRAMTLAEAEARRFRSPHVDTAHLLLGLLREPVGRRADEQDSHLATVDQRCGALGDHIGIWCLRVELDVELVQQPAERDGIGGGRDTDLDLPGAGHALDLARAGTQRAPLRRAEDGEWPGDVAAQLASGGGGQRTPAMAMRPQ